MSENGTYSSRSGASPAGSRYEVHELDRNARHKAPRHTPPQSCVRTQVALVGACQPNMLHSSRIRYALNFGKSTCRRIESVADARMHQPMVELLICCASSSRITTTKPLNVTPEAPALSWTCLAAVCSRPTLRYMLSEVEAQFPFRQRKAQQQPCQNKYSTNNMPVS